MVNIQNIVLATKRNVKLGGYVCGLKGQNDLLAHYAPIPGAKVATNASM